MDVNQAGNWTIYLIVTSWAENAVRFQPKLMKQIKM